VPPPATKTERSTVADRGMRQAGYAMIGVLIFASLSLFSLTSAYAQIHQLYFFEETSNRIPVTSDGIQEALGAGLARLQTGEPAVGSNSKYECNLKLRDSAGALVEYRMIYTKLANNQFSLEARPAGPARPTCPVTFTDGSCPLP
jgi:hypothetical protein